MYFHTTKFLGNFFFLHNSHCVRPGDGGVIKSCRDFCPIVYCYYFYHYYYYHYYFSLQGCSHCGDVKSVILRKKCHIAIVTQKVACYCYVKSVIWWIALCSYWSKWRLWQEKLRMTKRKSSMLDFLLGRPEASQTCRRLSSTVTHYTRWNLGLSRMTLIIATPYGATLSFNQTDTV